jgi:hypothetical protein
MHASAILALIVAGSVAAVPNLYGYHYTPDNIVKVNSVADVCILAPRDPHTDIGVAEGSGTRTYCTAKARYDKARQGQLPVDFFSDAKYTSYKGPSGGEIRQITGCIRASKLSRLNPKDQGGQFDSSGQGNDGVPPQSFCILPGKNKRGFYVQLIEPAQNRFCIRCCVNNSDCPHTNDTKGCPVAIPGYYGRSCR